MTWRHLVLAAALLAVPSFATPVDARPRPARMKSDFQANKTFGVGLMVGAPTGLSGKLYLSRDTALDFGLGAYYAYREHGGLHVHMDFLWHPVVLARTDPFELPLYVGVGGRILFDDDHGHRHDRDHDHGDLAVGARVPIGVALDFNRVPLDIFVELAMVVDIIAVHSHVDLTGAFGVRYYFE